MASYLLRRNDARVCSCWSCSSGLTWHSWSDGRRGIQIRSTCWRVVSNFDPQPPSAGGGGAGRLHRGRSECVYVRGCCCARDAMSDSCHRIDQAGAGWLHFFFFCQRPDCDAFAGSTAGKPALDRGLSRRWIGGGRRWVDTLQGRFVRREGGSWSGSRVQSRAGVGCHEALHGVACTPCCGTESAPAFL